jgi:hypothetical protein
MAMNLIGFVEAEPQFCHVFYVAGMKLGVDIEG